MQHQQNLFHTKNLTQGQRSIHVLALASEWEVSRCSLTDSSFLPWLSWPVLQCSHVLLPPVSYLHSSLACNESLAMHYSWPSLKDRTQNLDGCRERQRSAHHLSKIQAGLGYQFSLWHPGQLSASIKTHFVVVIHQPDSEFVMFSHTQKIIRRKKISKASTDFD